VTEVPAEANPWAGLSERSVVARNAPPESLAHPPQPVGTAPTAVVSNDSCTPTTGGGGGGGGRTGGITSKLSSCTAPENSDGRPRDRRQHPGQPRRDLPQVDLDPPADDRGEVAAAARVPEIGPAGEGERRHQGVRVDRQPDAGVARDRLRVPRQPRGPAAGRRHEPDRAADALPRGGLEHGGAGGAPRAPPGREGRRR